ncbi:MAG: sialate O-acetylesterase [Gemmataceae bacterium]|nr:sialate O-acetylesterase [Gemmataceae bacterium]MDW8266047.1 sialate O-acetylesterase [Gemmataceae bacterium]
MHSRSWVSALAGWLVVGLSAVQAEVKPHALFSDHMVLPRGAKTPVWGTAADGETVTVRFLKQEKTTTAKNGRWLVYLENLQAGGPYELTITGTNTITLKNVLIGDVWLCSGQSNMAWAVRSSAGADEAIAAPANPMIRLFTVPRRLARTPQTDVAACWEECSPTTVAAFSAVGYYFGRDLQKALNVPIGLINSSVGGTPAEAWTSKSAFLTTPELKAIVDQDEQNYPAALAAYPKLVEKYKEALARHKDAVAKAKAEGKPIPAAPRPPVHPDNSTSRPAVLFNGMIAPLQPFAIRGVIWYQGESNAGRYAEYQALLSAMIQDWRKGFGCGDFPFLIVQLAPFMKIETEPTDTAWARLREAQLKTTQSVKNCALAVITDLGDENDIHPKQKAPVGQRLALAARALAYGEQIVYSGPEFERMTVDGSKAVLHFRHVGSGLVAKGDKLTGFTICGEDRRFVPAEARIEGHTVVISSPQVARPVAVRYGWANYPVVNLWNKEGLPATPFRTDDFPMVATPAKPAKP